MDLINFDIMIKKPDHKFQRDEDLVLFTYEAFLCTDNIKTSDYFLNLLKSMNVNDILCMRSIIQTSTKPFAHRKINLKIRVNNQSILYRQLDGQDGQDYVYIGRDSLLKLINKDNNTFEFQMQGYSKDDSSDCRVKDSQLETRVQQHEIEENVQQLINQMLTVHIGNIVVFTQNEQNKIILNEQAEKYLSQDILNQINEVIQLLEKPRTLTLLNELRQEISIMNTLIATLPQLSLIDLFKQNIQAYLRGEINVDWYIEKDPVKQIANIDTRKLFEMIKPQDKDYIDVGVVNLTNDNIERSLLGITNKLKLPSFWLTEDLITALSQLFLQEKYVLIHSLSTKLIQLSFAYFEKRTPDDAKKVLKKMDFFNNDTILWVHNEGEKIEGEGNHWVLYSIDLKLLRNENKLSIQV